MPQTKIPQLIRQFYDRVDQLVAPLTQRHAERMQCRKGCHECCQDELTVFEVEALNIRETYPRLLSEKQPHQQGKCSFLDENGSCRIYDSRPYVCRTQGLPLRWIDEIDEDQLAEFRDICPLNDSGQPVETLDPEDCWTLGPFEQELASMQVSLNGFPLRRVPLRSLFQQQ
ncbi:MAG: YkgJ family cysteine cluster protein [SAR324 cluster bacterium]|nr:YkgJ family cysteine cluster protein [SAR324 cluster bacterium]